MRSIALLPLALCLFVSACARPGGEGAEEARELLEQNMKGPKVRAMAHCPSTVPGAKTALSELPGGVALTVTAPDEPGARAIRALSRARAAARPTGGEVVHSGRSTGGGKLGYCPVVVAGTDIAVEDVAGGAKILVRARDRGFVAALQQATRARVAALPKSATR
jgi:TusA-related sulfurtransferase